MGQNQIQSDETDRTPEMKQSKDDSPLVTAQVPLSPEAAAFDVSIEQELTRSDSEFTRLTANINAARHDPKVASALFFHPALQQKMAEFIRSRLLQLSQRKEPTNLSSAFWLAFGTALSSLKDAQPLIYKDRDDFFKRLWMYFDFEVRSRRRKVSKRQAREKIDRGILIDSIAVDPHLGAAEIIEVQDDLKRAVDFLQTANFEINEREVLQQVFLLGRPQHDFANEYSVAPSTVSKWKSSGLQKLRRFLETE